MTPDQGSAIPPISFERGYSLAKVSDLRLKLFQRRNPCNRNRTHECPSSADGLKDARVLQFPNGRVHRQLGNVVLASQSAKRRDLRSHREFPGIDTSTQFSADLCA